MAFPFPSDISQKRVKDSKKPKIKRVRRRELNELISIATRAAHIARDKGFFTVSLEARQCVQIIREIQSLPLTPRLIFKTDTFRAIQFLATNGNPKIRSESKALLSHLKSILDKDKNGRDSKSYDHTQENMKKTKNF